MFISDINKKIKYQHKKHKKNFIINKTSMGLILKILTIFFLFLTTKTQTSWSYYPEDISQIDYLTYSESNEYYIASFYSKGSDNSEDIFQDLKNGILIYPLTKEKIISSVCSTYYHHQQHHFNQHQLQNMMKIGLELHLIHHYHFKIFLFFLLEKN